MAAQGLCRDAANQLKLLLPLEEQTSKTMGQPATEDKDFFLSARASNFRLSRAFIGRQEQRHAKNSSFFK